MSLGEKKRIFVFGNTGGIFFGLYAGRVSADDVLFYRRDFFGAGLLIIIADDEASTLSEVELILIINSWQDVSAILLQRAFSFDILFIK